MIVEYKGVTVFEGGNVNIKRLAQEMKIAVSELNIVYNKKEENAKRDALLKEGTLTADGKIWFNLEKGQMFISGAYTLDEGELYYWKDVNGEDITLSPIQAKAYAKEMRITLQRLYGFQNA